MTRRRSLALLLFGLGVGAITPAHAAGARNAPVPVVATWFSDLHPRVGGHETVYVRFWVGTHRLSGARFRATLLIGKKVLLRESGTSTDRQGRTHVSFRVPSAARGRLLRARTELRYHGRRYTGNNSVRVRG